MLPRKQMQPTMYEQLSDQAKELWDQGLADVQIAARLNCSPPTVVAAVEHWHRSRGLEPPSHATRRVALLDRIQEMYEQQRSIRDIAKDIGMCTRSVTLLLRERFAKERKAMPDGRTRRWARQVNESSEHLDSVETPGAAEGRLRRIPFARADRRCRSARAIFFAQKGEHDQAPVWLVSAGKRASVQ